MSGDSIEHDRISYNVRSALDLACGAGLCAVFGPDVQVFLGMRTNGRPHYGYPDTTVPCDPADQRRGNTLIESPRLVIEVLSPGTEAKDRGVKFQAYQGQETIQEIVLINQFAPYVEIWRRNEDDPENPKVWHYRHYGPDRRVELASLNALVDMTAIYRGIAFDDGNPEEE